MSDEDEYYQRAEFMIIRGYVPSSTDPNTLAQKLRANDTNKKGVINTRENVYGEDTKFIEKILEDKAPVEKKLVGPYESIANKKTLDKL